MFHKSSSGLRTLLFQITCSVVLCLCTIPMTSCIKTKYFSLEHPKITGVNSEYLTNIVFKSRLKSRSNPIHYVDFNCTVLKTFNNNIKFTIAFYQLLSNVYKPSFVEYTMRVCDLVKKDVLIAAAFIEGFNRMPPDTRPIPELVCPMTPGNYSFTNMIIPLKNIPAGFPFGDGRLYVNATRFNILIVNYSFTNMMIPTATIPAGFPFLEGRLYGNMTQSNVLIGSIQIDFQLLTTNV